MATIVQKTGSARVGVQITGWNEIGAQLERLPIEVRGTELEKAVRKGINRIKTRARQLVPPPGYPGDKPDKKALRDTIGVVLRRYKGGAVIAGVAGPEYPAGAHGHLVEAGTAPHTITSKMGKTWQHPGSKPHQFMAPAVADVAPSIESDIVNALVKAANKAAGSG
jgi:HK97 gp10 family phage protein